jgi:hypothetical protein
MKNKLTLFVIILFTLVGCKKKYQDTFEYKILDKKICAIKNKTIQNANEVNWLFHEVRNSTVGGVSGNLQIDQSSKDYLFCYNLDEFKKEIGKGSIQSDVAIEIDSGSSVQEYNLRNYSCILSNTIKFNLSESDSTCYE